MRSVETASDPGKAAIFDLYPGITLVRVVSTYCELSADREQTGLHVNSVLCKSVQWALGEHYGDFLLR